MKLKQLISRPVVESQLSLQDFEPKKHPLELADTVDAFNRFLKDVMGYQDADVNAVRYLGFNAGKYTFITLSEDDTDGERYIVSKFFVNYNSEAKLTGDWSGMPSFTGDDLDEADDAFRKAQKHWSNRNE